ncbi:MAG: hypothetical protein KJ714_00045 [Euryarchaeota archaeon]|nr:hypothetical protein [Euryarchaeota archaeon]
MGKRYNHWGELTAKNAKTAKQSSKCHRTRIARMTRIDTDPCSWNGKGAARGAVLGCIAPCICAWGFAREREGLTYFDCCGADRKTMQATYLK